MDSCLPSNIYFTLVSATGLEVTRAKRVKEIVKDSKGKETQKLGAEIWTLRSVTLPDGLVAQPEDGQL